MGSMTVVADAPHAVCIPFPAQSHIKAMLKFAKILHRKGFRITFVNTEFNHQRFLHARGPNSLDGLPGFRFETIPDGLPPSDSNATQSVRSLCDSILKYFLAPFFELLLKLNTPTSDNLPVTCIISDGIMPFSVTAAQELRIPVVMLFTVSACSLMGFMQLATLRDKGLTPLKEDSECLHWHNSKAPNSVVYVNFGSVIVMTAGQLVEFASGLANSKHPFLWIIRPDLVKGESAVLPSEFVEETKERGLIASWCPQEEVLNHPAVGRVLNTLRVEFNY
ncbi:UDP-glycosyltransferase 85A5 [Morella rubra]|uniref:UDP-glycosyltransferase 85A5 n=1 Tax=Morella rubra TaxID=262757 RepID=A0A6A1W5M0_9ROSI|nr:UDP-glycosyltransferase 85A5 [Morella rubra]